MSIEENESTSNRLAEAYRKRPNDFAHQCHGAALQDELLKANAALVNEAKAHQWEHKVPDGRYDLRDQPTTLKEVSELHERARAEQAVRMAFVNGPSQERRFTRAEVLTALRTLHADTGVVAGKEALDRAFRAFERME